MKLFLTIVSAGLFLCSGICSAQAKGAEVMIEKGKKVSFDYTLTVDGEIVDTSKDRGPLEYTHGNGQIIPGLASQMEGLKAGEEKTIEVGPEDAYGNINPAAFKEVPKTSLPEGFDAQPGAFLQMQGPGGQAVPVRISEVKDNDVVIDLNHPLAGKTLKFDVKIVEIN